MLIPTTNTVGAMNAALAAARSARIDELKARLAARQDKPGYKLNVQHIKREIARLEQESSK